MGLLMMSPSPLLLTFLLEKPPFLFPFSTSLLLILPALPTISTLSCLKCEPSHCEPQKAEACKSKELTDDPCGCCKVCASAEGDNCGGPWAISGTCASNLTILVAAAKSVPVLREITAEDLGLFQAPVLPILSVNARNLMIRLVLEDVSQTILPVKSQELNSRRQNKRLASITKSSSVPQERLSSCQKS